MKSEVDVARVMTALKTLRAPVATGEYDLHELISGALTDAELEFYHEYKLAPGMRADFFLDGIVIEVKKGKPVRSKLIEQAARYLSRDSVQALIVVSQKNVSLPEKMSGKPVYSLSLDKLWGVSLP